MEKKSLIICVVVGFLGLVAAVLGFAAEGKRIKASQVREIQPGLCSYPRSPSYALGVTAALSLLVAQIVINVASGCICCRKNPYTSTTHWTLALVCFIISWFTFVVAFLLLLGGAALNDEHGVENEYFSYYYCYVVKPGVFAVAAILCLASVTLGILYYLTISSGKDNFFGNTIAPNQSGIAMGQAQVPPTSQDPVFVHEDTYVRRQFT
ncbi:protein VASCULATURE COMPLEXITY AND CONNECTIVITY [Amaranthus tricolor]|uniref:protein VASCULATURE COMPLEXITY AND CONNECTIVITY n=1 Tax=Amaranthus tricolor TaxID=29722 RepID=UPI0025888F71|nr:protein VASCULATURE COMPLEXITY AND CONNECTIVITY [Amaranthus tricolor]